MKNLLLSVGGDLRYLSTHQAKGNAGHLWWVAPLCILGGMVILFGWFWFSSWWSAGKKDQNEK